MLNYLPFQEFFTGLIVWIGSLGFWGGFIFIGVYVLATVLFIPGLLLTLGAGFLFGVVRGSVYVSIGSTLGAVAAFLIGRYLARSWVEQKIAKNQKFKAIDGAVAAEAWKFVGLCRLSPVFPFNLLNYALGVTKVSLRDYFFASWLGMLPGTVMYVYLGSLVKDFTSIGLQNQPVTPAEWIIRGVGFLATVGVTIYGTVIAKKSLNYVEKEKG
ncbi:TVP38/TMEM64 family protein [Ancylothrix sp. C2]|uniref:TVP38/TMEM64 family protein n=1 Tax=Ancylothrix sp. D3o TaxID=2953691 RepID=UPI0021BA5159|nr:TVP38/TMEM64 family protein [Ancylothrix sp. D3o]MCT7948309.1 TVP38/TMEM64 family protein [Ancylothrix sp. D3o]